MEEIKIEIYGRVQGVGFRHFVKECADRFGVKGRVMNRDDGSIMVIAQGERVKLEGFLQKIQNGPQFSHVEGVSFFWRKPEGKFDDFIIALDKGMLEDQKRNFFNLGKNVLGIRDRIPKHVAIIPDGNRRWAKERGMQGSLGHEKAGSSENLMKLFNEANELGLNHLTFWAFSTDNWKREKKEVDFLFKLLKKSFDEFQKEFVKEGIRFKHIGRKDRLPKDIVARLEKLEKDTAGNEGLNVSICMDYGGRDEILRAVNKLLKEGVKEIEEDDFKNYLDSAGIPDPDLIIRTSGESRTSGFMPFQSAYSEFYFCDVNFPDFGPEELRKAVAEFGRRKRNFGK